MYKQLLKLNKHTTFTKALEVFTLPYTIMDSYTHRSKSINYLVTILQRQWFMLHTIHLKNNIAPKLKLLLQIPNDDAGNLPWTSTRSNILMVEWYYCTDASGTILSPTDVVCTYLNRFDGWHMHTNINTTKGYLLLNARNGINHVHYNAFMKNNLWFHYLNCLTTNKQFFSKTPSTVVYQLNDLATYELWHHRLGHPG